MSNMNNISQLLNFGQFSPANFNKQLGGLGQLQQKQSDKAQAPGQPQDFSSMIDAARQVGQGGDSISISASAVNMSMAFQNGRMSVNYTRMELTASIGLNNARQSPGLGVFNEGGIKNLMDVMYKFAGEKPLAEGAELTAPSEKVQEYWNAENTGGRIADFALSYFPIWAEQQGKEPTEELRQEYVDWISKAVEKGFEEAQPFVEGISDAIDQKVQSIHDKIWERFEDFVKNGEASSPEQARNSLKQGLGFVDYIHHLPEPGQAGEKDADEQRSEEEDKKGRGRVNVQA